MPAATPQLRIAIVAPPGAPDPHGQTTLVADLGAGLARRGHRVRVYADERGLERSFRRLRADGADAISQHAFEPAAIELAEGLPVLHTLHGLPTPAMRQACAQSAAAFATVSGFAADKWLAAGIENVKIIRNGVPDLPLLGAAVKPVALMAQGSGSVAMRAAERAGLQAKVVSAMARAELRHLMAQCALCLLPLDEQAYDYFAAEAQFAGCPVVGYARGVLLEMVEHEVSGILAPPGDEFELARAARRALALDRRRVRASAHERLALEPMLDRYEAELVSLAERQRAPLAPVIPLLRARRLQSEVTGPEVTGPFGR